MARRRSVIEWPAVAKRTMSERDRSYPDFHPDQAQA